MTGNRKVWLNSNAAHTVHLTSEPFCRRRRSNAGRPSYRLLPEYIHLRSPRHLPRLPEPASQDGHRYQVTPCAVSRLQTASPKRLGIVHERIQAGRPQQNGRHERMHRTLKEDTTKPPATSFRAQQSRFDNFRYVFNNERPHEGLNNQVPASLYHPSSVRLPRKLPEFTYPKGLLLRRVNNSGDIRCHKKQSLHQRGREFEKFEQEAVGLSDQFIGGLAVIISQNLRMLAVGVEDLRHGVDQETGSGWPSGISESASRSRRRV
jgi:Integrase core domain